MTQKNVPVQMIAYCGSDGEIRPIRFRFEDDAHAMHTICVEEIVDSRECCYVGREAFRFLCHTAEDDRRLLMELSYFVRSHTWTLLRAVY